MRSDLSTSRKFFRSTYRKPNFVLCSLSGTFPFQRGRRNRRREFCERRKFRFQRFSFVQQIRNANFMFPSNPWKDISNEGNGANAPDFCSLHRRTDFAALSFVQSLLELESKRRLLINKVFLQPWLQVLSDGGLAPFARFEHDEWDWDCTRPFCFVFSDRSDFASFASSKRWLSAGCCQRPSACFLRGVFVFLCVSERDVSFRTINCIAICASSKTFVEVNAG